MAKASKKAKKTKAQNDPKEDTEMVDEEIQEKPAAKPKKDDTRKLIADSVANKFIALDLC